MTKKEELIIRTLVSTAVSVYAEGFSLRHIAEKNNPDGVINMKIHNVFIEALGKEMQYYTSLVRSLDSSLGNMLETLAINIAKLNYDVRNYVEGPLSARQTKLIAQILESYKSHDKKPKVGDYNKLITAKDADAKSKKHSSDYYLVDRKKNFHYLIELKIGGDLDNKKARSEKEAILEQYAILANTLPAETPIKIYFATAYNRFGENVPWRQERVRQFFADDELLIGKDFWNFVCNSTNGYGIVLDEYKKSAHVITEALNKIKEVYLG